MLSKALARGLALHGIHYAWVIVALAFLFGVCASATLSIPGVLLVPMSREFGWSIGDLSSPLGLRLALFGLVTPFAGGLMRLYGLRAVLIGSATLLTGGLLLTIHMTAFWQMWLSLGVILGIATGLTSLVLASTIATTWFETRRGLVLGILSAGTATGQLVFLPLAAWLSDHYGWRSALVPSILAIAALAAIIVLFFSDHPSRLGLAPFGGQATAPPRLRAGENAFMLSLGALADGSRSPTFWGLAFTFFVCGVTSFGLTPHFVTLCGDHGISELTSTGLLSVVGVCDLIGTIGSGWLSDRYDNRLLLAWYYGLRGLSLIWLTFSDFSLVGLSAFAVFYGLDFIATAPPTVRLAARSFGAERAPLVFGWISATHNLGAGIMAALTGISRDALASYLPAFLTGGLLCLVATAVLLVFRPAGQPKLAVSK